MQPAVCVIAIYISYDFEAISPAVPSPSSSRNSQSTSCVHSSLALALCSIHPSIHLAAEPTSSLSPPGLPPARSLAWSLTGCSLDAGCSERGKAIISAASNAVTDRGHTSRGPRRVPSLLQSREVSQSCDPTLGENYTSRRGTPTSVAIYKAFTGWVDACHLRRERGAATSRK